MIHQACSPQLVQEGIDRPFLHGISDLSQCSDNLGCYGEVFGNGCGSIWSRSRVYPVTVMLCGDPAPLPVAGLNPKEQRVFNTLCVRDSPHIKEMNHNDYRG